MDEALKEAIRRGIEARKSDPGFYDREAEKRTRRRDNSRDEVKKATSVPWSQRKSNPSPVKTDREKRARLPVNLPQQEAGPTLQVVEGHWRTFDPITGEYLGRLERIG